MRIKFSGVFLCLAIVFMCSSVYAKEPRTGLSIIPTFNSLGLGIRSWRTAQFGWELQGNTSFDGDYKTGLAKLMYSPSTDKSRFYLFGGLGGFSYSGDNWSGSSSYYAIGTGWEWLKGIRKNQGASFEIGLQFGEVEYEFSYGGYTSTITFELPNPYIGGNYVFYF